MNQLISDVQIVIFSFLEPEDIIRLFVSSNYFKNILLELCNHVGFVVKCYRYISEEDRIWYQNHSIPIEFIKEYVETLMKKKWLLNGKIHRDNDEPAIIENDGTLLWYQHGLIHRDNDLPAFVDEKRRHFMWYQHGFRYRHNDQPALIKEDQFYAWFNKRGEYHRDNDLPAYKDYFFGRTVWYQNGLQHRDDIEKPTEIWDCNGKQIWYRHGKFLKEK